MTPTGRNALLDLFLAKDMQPQRNALMDVYDSLPDRGQLNAAAAGLNPDPEGTGDYPPGPTYFMNALRPLKWPQYAATMAANAPYAARDVLEAMGGISGAADDMRSGDPDRVARGDRTAAEIGLMGATLLMGGGAVATASGATRGGLGAFGSISKSARDMSDAARLARARELGFDTENIFYHGSQKKFDEFDPSMSDDVGIYFTTDYRNAANYATPEGGISEVYLRYKNPYIAFAEADGAGGGRFLDAHGKELPFKTNNEIADFARRSGHDAMVWPEGNLTETDNTVAVFDPSNIRSINAAFDPKHTKSAKLLYGLAPPIIPDQDNEY